MRKNQKKMVSFDEKMDLKTSKRSQNPEKLNNREGSLGKIQMNLIKKIQNEIK